MVIYPTTSITPASWVLLVLYNVTVAMAHVAPKFLGLPQSGWQVSSPEYLHLIHCDEEKLPSWTQSALKIIDKIINCCCFRSLSWCFLIIQQMKTHFFQSKQWIIDHSTIIFEYLTLSHIKFFSEGGIFFVNYDIITNSWKSCNKNRMRDSHIPFTFLSSLLYDSLSLFICLCVSFSCHSSLHLKIS